MSPGSLTHQPNVGVGVKIREEKAVTGRATGLLSIGTQSRCQDEERKGRGSECAFHSQDSSMLTILIE